MMVLSWFECLDDLLSNIILMWNGMIVVIGDVNFDFFCVWDFFVLCYISIFDMFGLE